MRHKLSVLSRATIGRKEAGEAMSAEEVAILADDLTGALDAAAPFAGTQRPVAAVWGESPPPSAGGFAVDSETREVSPRRAEAVVGRVLPCLAGRAIALKKIDSLLRGNTVAEIAACWKRALFRRLVVAPAFPAQGRATRGARQFARIAGEWQPAAPDLVAALENYGVTARRAAPGDDISGEGVFVCDAETDQDLQAIVAAGRRAAAPLLWCGAAGLARALAGPAVGPVEVEGRRRLAVVGTRHPVTAAQVGRLAASSADGLAFVANVGDIEGAIGHVEVCLRRRQSAALVFRLPPLAPAEAAAIAGRVFAALSRIEPPDLVAVTGGETLMRLCTALAANRLDALGEWRPGIPVTRIAGGVWSGVTLVSKSGAFGTDDVLAALVTPHGAAAS
jgi:uncharacterized protein YgbK (DUF1537 family)